MRQTPFTVTNLLRDNEATGVLAGLPIRYSIEAQGRHESASTGQWLDEFGMTDGALDLRQ